LSKRYASTRTPTSKLNKVAQVIALERQTSKSQIKKVEEIAPTAGAGSPLTRFYEMVSTFLNFAKQHLCTHRWLSRAITHEHASTNRRSETLRKKTTETTKLRKMGDSYTNDRPPFEQRLIPGFR